MCSSRLGVACSSLPARTTTSERGYESRSIRFPGASDGVRTSSPALRRCPSAIGIDGTYLSLCQRQTWLRRRSRCLSTVSRVCRGYLSCRYGHVCGQEHDRSGRSLVTKFPSLRWLDPASCLLSAESCCLAHRPAYSEPTSRPREAAAPSGIRQPGLALSSAAPPLIGLVLGGVTGLWENGSVLDHGSLTPRPRRTRADVSAGSGSLEFLIDSTDGGRH